MDCTATGFARNINLPQSIQYKLSIVSGNKYKFNNIVYRCGGMNINYDTTKYCAALILNACEFDQNETITAYNWQLPSFPLKIASNYLFYSYNKSTLFSIGGLGDTSMHLGDIYTLSFADEAYFSQNKDDWKWNKLNTKIPTPRYSVCCTMIDNSAKLIIIGGCAENGNDNGCNVVELFDIEKNVWIDVKNRSEPVMDSGIYYDDMNEIVYVGGGRKAKK